VASFDSGAVVAAVGHSTDTASAAAAASVAAAAASVAAAVAATTPRPRWRGVVTLPAGAASSPIAPPSELLARTRQVARGPAPPPNFPSAKIASAQLQAQLHAQLQAPPSPVKTDAPPDRRVVSHAPAAAL
jgi:hypothetical protein